MTRGGTLEQQLALPQVAGERCRALEFRAGLVIATQLRKLARIGVAAEVMNDLGGAVEASRLMEVPDRVENHELDARRAQARTTNWQLPSTAPSASHAGSPSLHTTRRRR